MSTYVELGDLVKGSTDPRGLAVLLPGRVPPFSMPLLLSAGWAAIASGWRVRLVDWDPPDDGGPDWTARELQAAVGDHDGEVLVVGNSLATTSAPYVTERGYDAIWLNPLLHRPAVVEAITRHPGRQLLVGGTEDPSWRLDLGAGSGTELLEIPGVEHGLFVPGDAVRTAEVHLEVTRRIVDWLDTDPGRVVPRSR